MNTPTCTMHITNGKREWGNLNSFVLFTKKKCLVKQNKTEKPKEKKRKEEKKKWQTTKKLTAAINVNVTKCKNKCGEEKKV